LHPSRPRAHDVCESSGQGSALAALLQAAAALEHTTQGSDLQNSAIIAIIIDNDPIIMMQKKQALSM
jgi:hypothetical protein